MSIERGKYLTPVSAPRLRVVYFALPAPRFTTMLFDRLQMLLTEAHVETDIQKLKAKLNELEGLLTERVFSETSPPNLDERKMMSIMFNQMEELRIEKLGYPDWRNFISHRPDL